MITLTEKALLKRIIQPCYSEYYINNYQFLKKYFYA